MYNTRGGLLENYGRAILFTFCSVWLWESKKQSARCSRFSGGTRPGGVSIRVLVSLLQNTLRQSSTPGYCTDRRARHRLVVVYNMYMPRHGKGVDNALVHTDQGLVTDRQLSIRVDELADMFWRGKKKQKTGVLLGQGAAGNYLHDKETK